jgi:hypothetical protein
LQLFFLSRPLAIQTLWDAQTTDLDVNVFSRLDD